MNEFCRLWKRPDVLRHSRMPSGQWPEFRHEMWIRKEADIEYQVGILGHSVFEPKADARHEDVLVRGRLLFKLINDMRAQLVDIEFRRVNHQVGNCPNRLQMAAFRQ